MARLLPLFPLQLVVFPGNLIPLHIFEERYREMVGDAAANSTEFGIVLAREGGIVNTGCTVLVENIVNRYPDGRFDVLTRGHRRFEIIALNQEKACLRGEVEYFDDDDVAPAAEDLRTQAIETLVHMRRSLNQEELNPEKLKQDNDTSPDPAHPLLSFQLAQEIDDLDFKMTLQQERSEPDRLKKFIKFVEAYIPRQEYTTRVRRAAPQNGFGHKPAGV